MSAASEDRDQREAVDAYHKLLDTWLATRDEDREVLRLLGMKAPDDYFNDDPAVEALNNAFVAAATAVTRNRDNQ